MVTWRESVNKSVGNERIQDIQKYLKEGISGYKSPIDRFYVEAYNIINYCTSTHAFIVNEFLGPLLYVGMISNAENYFREVMAECIRICPICKSASANHSVSLGSVVWLGNGMLEKGTFENTSFSDVSAIKKELKNCLQVDVKGTDLLWGLLEEYEKLCQMRHAIVHSRRIIAGKNATKLNIPASDKDICVKIGYDELQECASICTACVLACNLRLFEEICKRWAIEWRRMDFWESEKENILFSEIWDVFSSQIDQGSIFWSGMTKTKCKNAIKKEFNL